MILTEENLEEWKKELDKEFNMRTQTTHNIFSNTLSNKEWLKSNLGEDHTDVVSEELSYWD